ncbi:unnamed protein product [Mesocestoides corti]|uniref:Pre-rRNA-processing protein Ipi1 N-terminal domain-containing protein n=1 Tax=Mesocestoides corti TaxID=53468 RepID=A0A158QUL3_MESCO|nr:unnamed protein product [Mesocestoides corti]
MPKKKVKDFNKVKLKLGRKLKRQNETVIDLSKRKIILPKENTVLLHDVPREPVSVLDGFVKKLQSTNESLQLSAISCLHSILSPFVAQITTEWNCRPFISCSANSLELLNNLFGSDFARNDFNFQFGDLLHCLNRLSQNSTSVKLPFEIAKLCKMIATIFSVHPRIHSALTCVDGITSSLLRRSEFWWRQAGVKVLSDHCAARHTVLTCLASVGDPSHAFALEAELKAFVEPRHQVYRVDVFPCYIPGDSLSSDFPKPDAVDASLLSTWMLFDPDLALQKSADQLSSSVFEKPGITKKRGPAHLANRPPPGVDSSIWYDRKLALCVLKEGFYLLDELVHSPKVETIFGLIHTLRGLRVFAETKHLRFFSSSKGLPDISAQLGKFCRRIRELVPLDVEDDVLLPEDAEINGAASTVGSVASLSRKALKKAAKRSAKVARREEAAALSADSRGAKTSQPPRLVKGGNASIGPTSLMLVSDSVSTPSGTYVHFLASDQTTQPASKRSSKSSVVTHLLKQHILELWWNLVALACPQHGDCKVFSQELASLLLSYEVGEEGDSLPPLTFLNSSSPALAWRWLRAFDYCLLYGLRIRELPSDSGALCGIVAPMVTALFHIVHRWCCRHKTHRQSPSRVPRLVVRSAGILTAFLCQELKLQAWCGQNSTFYRSRTAPSSSDGLQYDASWIEASLCQLGTNSSLCNTGDLFATLTTDLCDLVESESADASATNRWIWAAACLQSLARNRYSPALHGLTQSVGLRKAVDTVGDWRTSAGRLHEPLVYLPCPETGCYSSLNAWKCTPIERIFSQDVADS